MKFAYADPPYLGSAMRHYSRLHPEAAVYDELDGHRVLIGRLVEEFPDGWVMSASSPSLRKILPLCPEDIRVGAWVKPFAVFKPGVNPAYCWEPVIWRGGRPREKQDDKVRDFLRANIKMQSGFPGAKPPEFCGWVFSLLNMLPGDEFVDMFPGSGAVSRAWDHWRASFDSLFA